MSYEQMERLLERIRTIPNAFLSGPPEIRVRYVPDMEALGGEVHAIRKGAASG